MRDKDNDRYKCSRVQYGIAVAHRLWDDLSQTFEHNDCDAKKKLANAKLMINWRLNRITGFCRLVRLVIDSRYITSQWGLARPSSI